MAVVKRLPTGAYSVYWSLGDYRDRIGRGLDTSGSTEFECEGRVGIHKLEFEFKASKSNLSLKLYCEKDPPLTTNVFSNLMMKHGVGRIVETNGLQLFNFLVDKVLCQSCPEKCNSEPPYFHLRLDFVDLISSEDETVLGFLSNAFDKQSAADVLFIVKGEKIKAHSLLVNLASAKLASMLKDSIKVPHAEDATTEKSENGCCEEVIYKEISIDDVEPKTFRQMLRYIYTGLVPELETEAEPLLAAARKYGIEDLNPANTSYIKDT